ncbi:GDNF family receptor alpha-like [Corythoichthys intestinalis]|uniref:GDNF family receptor alpha-like n=1 Tax=Corythoichthys intestinalis TaxID=161448 RepID=UPI0025A5B1AF|nr:GDNF family receptor alpha-like [Corythoichthys intestinalis]
MQRTQVQFAVLLGFLVPHVCSLASSTAHSACITCLSNLKGKEKDLFNTICRGCQIKDSGVCNLTIHVEFAQFTGPGGCVCAWEKEGGIQELLAQCELRPAPHKRRTKTDLQSSGLVEFEYTAGSCTEQIRFCVSNSICNKCLAPVLQACNEAQCDHNSCGQETQNFYGSVPHDFAERLVMCECDPSDVSCLQMKAAIHGSTCGANPWICQEVVTRCVEDQHCRDLLTKFQAKCWRYDESLCGDVGLQSECFHFMNPALILGGELECRKAFVATLGTALHHPCTCQHVHGADLDTCRTIHDVLHNRTHFKIRWMRVNGPSHPPAISESEEGQSGLSEYVLFGCTAILLVGILLMPLAILCKRRLVKKTKTQDKTRFQPLPKSSSTVTPHEFP